MLLKRIAATLLSLAIIISLCSCEAETTAADYTKSGRTISTAEEMVRFALEANVDYNNFAGETITLLADIDLSDRKWTSIGCDGSEFRGTFDGNGHKITGITIDRNVEGHLNCGLFNTLLAGGIIKNLSISGTIVIEGGEQNRTGMVAGENCGRIINCTVSGKLYAGDAGYNEAGGIAGYNQGEIENCISYCTIETNSISTKQGEIPMGDAGGIAGENWEGIIKGCTNKGQITVSGGTSSAGGIVAANYSGSILNCKNYGNIAASKSERNFIGGIVGVEHESSSAYENGIMALLSRTKKCIVSDCENNGDIVIEDTKEQNQIGGILGCSTAGNISSCTNDGNMTVNSNYYNSCGGIVGASNCNIANCVNTGNITTEGSTESCNESGGIVGSCDGGAVKNCYNTGDVVSLNGFNSSGGIISCYDAGIVENCYSAGKTVAKGSSDVYSSFCGGVLGRTRGNTTTNINIKNSYWLYDEQTGEPSETGYGNEVNLTGAYYFTENNGVLKAKNGTPPKDITLLDRLNRWTAGKRGMKKWVINPELNGGYPVLEGTQLPEEKPEPVEKPEKLKSPEKPEIPSTPEAPDKVDSPETGAGIVGWLFEVLFHWK